MAGNTKLIGFMGSQVVLERWGEKVTVEVGKEAVQAIHKACADDLPRRPLSHQVGRFNLSVEYDTLYGQGVLRMNPKVLDLFEDFLHQTMAEVPPGFAQYHREMVSDVERVLKEHREYTSTDEPGLP